MRVNAKTLPTEPIVSKEPLTPKELLPQSGAIEEVRKTVVDGYVTRDELNNVEAAASGEGQPFARQFAETFATLAEAKFSAANPAVRGFAKLMSHLLKPDPVTQVTSGGLVENALQKLWANDGNGGAAELKALETHFAAGDMTLMEAVIEATGLGRAQRADALIFFAAHVKSDADARVLVLAADIRSSMSPDEPIRTIETDEQQRDLGVALGGNPNVNVKTTLEAVKPLRGFNFDWGPAQTNLRADVLHAILKGHPDPATARELTPQLRSVAFKGAVLTRDVLPLAEDLLAHGASLGQVLSNFPHVNDLYFDSDPNWRSALLSDSDSAIEAAPFDVQSPEMIDLAVRHAGSATDEDAKTLASALEHFHNPPKARQVIEAISRGSAKVDTVLLAIRRSGLDEEKAQLALNLYDRKSSTPDELLKIHGYVAQYGNTAAIQSSVEKLIDSHAFSKDQLRPVIENVSDRTSLTALQKRLNAQS